MIKKFLDKYLIGILHFIMWCAITMQVFNWLEYAHPTFLVTFLPLIILFMTSCLFFGRFLIIKILKLFGTKYAQ